MEWIIYGFISYFVYKYIKSNRLSPEQKELLRIANENQINDIKIREQFLNTEITLEEAIEFQKKKIKSAEDIKRKRREALAKSEAELIAKLSSHNNRIYFCYSLVNNNSPLYLINPETNKVLDSSATDLCNLYNEGWRLMDVDKTGKNAQLDSLNAILRFENIKSK